MSKTSPPSSLAERIRLHVPTRWAALTQADLYYYFALVAACPDENADCIKAQFLLRRCLPAPAHVVLARLHPAALLGAMECLDFFDRIPARPVRIERIGRARAVAPDLVDSAFSLQDYLTCENLYTAALAGGRDEALRQMCKILYRTPAGEYATNIRPRPVHLVAVFFWWCAIHRLLARRYDELFRPAPADQDQQSLQERQRESTDAQIRALTGGDITKEAIVLNSDVHRALTELNAKAREASELHKLANRYKT